MTSVVILDYGSGNVRSAQRAVETTGAKVSISADFDEALAADALLVPGVGAFGACMSALRDVGLESVALDAVASGVPFMGICVGMQMLFDGSEEDSDARGLGIISGEVKWIPSTVQRPQMQWNRLDIVDPAEPILRDLGDEPYVYFVHSLHGVPDDPAVVAATGSPTCIVFGK